MPDLTLKSFETLCYAIALASRKCGPYLEMPLTCSGCTNRESLKTLTADMKRKNLGFCKRRGCASMKEFVATSVDALLNERLDLNNHCLNCQATIRWLQCVAQRVLSSSCRHAHGALLKTGKKVATKAQKMVIGDFAACVGAAADADANPNNKLMYPRFLLCNLEMAYANNYMIAE